MKPPPATETVYIRLLHRGVEVWRPAPAAGLGAGCYILFGPARDGETWEFPPGETVRCRARTLRGDDGKAGLCLVAYEALPARSARH